MALIHIALPGKVLPVGLLHAFRPSARYSHKVQTSCSATRTTNAELSSLLMVGWQKTLDAPKGQLFGRAGRQCSLEDAERILYRVKNAAPEWPLAGVAMAHNLLAQNHRELDAENELLDLLSLPPATLSEYMGDASRERVGEADPGIKEARSRFASDLATAITKCAAVLEETRQHAASQKLQKAVEALSPALRQALKQAPVQEPWPAYRF